MNFVLYSSPARIFCARLDLLLFRPWNPKLSNVRFFIYIYSFLVLERFLNKIHFFFTFSHVSAEKTFEFKTFPSFLTVNLGYYCIQSIRTPSWHAAYSICAPTAPPYLYQSTSQSNLICISFFLKTLSQVYFSWTLCVCNFIFLFSYRYLIWYDHLWLLLSVVSLISLTLQLFLSMMYTNQYPSSLFSSSLSLYK